MELYNCLILVRNIKIKCTLDSKTFIDKICIEKAKKIFTTALKGKVKLASNPFIYKKSIDARDNKNIFLIYTVAFPVFSEAALLSLPKGIDFVECDKPVFNCRKNHQNRPVVAGFGPSGMFCALALAKAGLRPIVVERGADIDKRAELVNKYWTSGVLDENTNVQFGEGGAGTFSDGKLLTRISDKLCRYVLEVFVRHGAPDEIMYLAKPHVGTDNLRNVVKNIRNEIISLGGEVLFNTSLTSFEKDTCGNVNKVLLSNGAEICCSALFLCIGHSARDTVMYLLNNGVKVEPKPFSVGVRIEHKRQDIDDALYGDFAGCESLGAASYTLSCKAGSRSVYSFCMCPGGVVVASASKDGEIVTNGMSYYSRNGENSNSAIAVNVDTSDYGNTVVGAIDFQHNIERRAFELCGNDGTAPIQLFGDLLCDSNRLSEPSYILPTYTGKTMVCSAEKVFPTFITDSLKGGISYFDREIKGFARRDAVLTFPETRTSCPVRIPRDEKYLSHGFTNLYPCGEGAGYAGGITSAAVDGIRAAMAFMNE